MRLVAALVLFAMWYGSNLLAEETPHLRGELIYEIHERFPWTHAATIVELKNGDLMAAWYSGSWEGAKNVKVHGAVKKKGAAGWSSPFVLADDPDRSEGNPVLWHDAKGRLWFCWVVMYPDGWENCKIFAKVSDDDGATWGPIRTLREELGWMTGLKAVVLADGTIVLPIYDEGKWLSLFMISEDDGETWSWTDTVKSEPDGNIQPAVIVRDDGSLLALMRAGGPQARRPSARKAKPKLFVWQSVSHDKGRTWSVAETTTLPNPDARVDVVKGKSGNVVVVFNNAHRGRGNLSVALSDDDGKTWPWIRSLEDESLPGYMTGEYSYPCVITASDGLYHVAYTYRKTNIKHVEFNEAWIKGTEGAPYPSEWYFSPTKLPMPRRR